jgi:hypothetical protein
MDPPFVSLAIQRFAPLFFLSTIDAAGNASNEFPVTLTPRRETLFGEVG